MPTILTSEEVNLGWAEIRPNFAYAKQKGTWKIHYHCGKQDLKKGSKIRIMPPFNGMGTWLRWDIGSVSATSDADVKASVCVIDKSKEEEMLRISRKQKFSENYTMEIIEITIEEGTLLCGETITVFMGDKRDGGQAATAQWLSGPDMPFYVEVDYNCSGEFILIANSPSIEVFGNAPDRLICTGPSTVNEGKFFSLRIKAEDAFTNISGLFNSHININYNTKTKLCYEDNIKGPCQTIITPQNKGQKTVAGFSLAQKGTYRINLSSKKTLPLESAPISTEFTQNNEHIYWGEIHGHTGMTDGVGTADRYYEYARDEAWLDFAGIGDHGGGWWSCCVDSARNFNKIGKFVTILGYEMSNCEIAGHFKHGHYNIYGRDLNLPHRVDPFNETQFEETMAMIRDGGAILIPHHTNDPLTTKIGAHFHWDQFDKDIIHAVEICQMRGSFEKDEVGKDNVLFGGFGCSVQDGLAKGFRFGFIGGTDNHCGRAGSPQETWFNSEGPGKGDGETQNIKKYSKIERTWCGLTAVFAPELTRAAVFDAIRNRYCYATTGTRILLNFNINGLHMGEEGVIQSPAKINIRIAGTNEIKSITIVRNNEDVYQVTGAGLDQEVTWEDPDVKPGYWYYPRIVQKDGHIAWASPIWSL